MTKLTAFIVLLLLVACGGDKADSPQTNSSDDNAKITKKADKTKSDDATKDLICPQVAILQAAERIMDYGGESPDPSQLVAAARMQKIYGDCGYQKEGIDINFTVHMTATRGGRLGGSEVNYPFFVAIVDPAENIVSRQLITAKFQFSGLDKQTSDDEPLHVFIPLSSAAMQAGPDYRVLLGFQIKRNQQLGN